MVEALHLDFFEEIARRKRQPWPPKSKWKRFMGRAIYIVGIFGPIMTIPQITKIWVEKNAAGVSVVSWSAYLAVAIFWVIYGITFKRKPIVFIYSIWIILEVFIVIGIIIHA